MIMRQSLCYFSSAHCVISSVLEAVKYVLHVGSSPIIKSINKLYLYRYLNQKNQKIYGEECVWCYIEPWSNGVI